MSRDLLRVLNFDLELKYTKAKMLDIYRKVLSIQHSCDPIYF